MINSQFQLPNFSAVTYLLRHRIAPTYLSHNGTFVQVNSCTAIINRGVIFTEKLMNRFLQNTIKIDTIEVLRLRSLIG